MFKKSKKTTCKFILIGLLAYALIISFSTAIFLDTHSFKTDFLDNYEDIINPFPGDGNNTKPPDEKTDPNVFDAQVILMSNVERGTSYNIHLFALPGQKSELYRDFSVYIYTSQKANYIVKVDNQTRKSGEVTWMERIDLNSEYETMDVKVILNNKTGVQRDFVFKKITLLDSPWQAKEDKDKDKDESVPDIIDPYIRMSRGELNEFVAKRVIADIAAVILGILFGVQIAALKADLRGIDRVL